MRSKAEFLPRCPSENLAVSLFSVSIFPFAEEILSNTMFSTHPVGGLVLKRGTLMATPDYDSLLDLIQDLGLNEGQKISTLLSEVEALDAADENEEGGEDE